MYPWQTFIVGLCEHLAWPFLTGGCIILFKKDIQKLLSRLTKLPGGAELHPEAQQEYQENKQNYDAELQKNITDSKEKFEEALKKAIATKEFVENTKNKEAK